jgi:hypothetical protein
MLEAQLLLGVARLTTDRKGHRPAEGEQPDMHPDRAYQTHLCPARLRPGSDPTWTQQHRRDDR